MPPTAASITVSLLLVWQPSCVAVCITFVHALCIVATCVRPSMRLYVGPSFHRSPAEFKMSTPSSLDMSFLPASAAFILVVIIIITVVWTEFHFSCDEWSRCVMFYSVLWHSWLNDWKGIRPASNLLHEFFVSDIAIFVLKRDVELQPTNSIDPGGFLSGDLIWCAVTNRLDKQNPRVLFVVNRLKFSLIKFVRFP